MFVAVPAAFILASASQVLAESKTSVTDQYGATGKTPDIKTWYEQLSLGHPTPFTDEYGFLGKNPNKDQWYAQLTLGRRTPITDEYGSNINEWADKIRAILGTTKKPK